MSHTKNFSLNLAKSLKEKINGKGRSKSNVKKTLTIVKLTEMNIDNARPGLSPKRHKQG